VSKRFGNAPFLPLDNTFASVKQRRSVPHQFVLDALSALSPETRPMFGCVAVYVGDKIMFALRDKQEHLADNGVWLATTKEHHDSLRQEFPNMRSIGVLGKNVTGWQILPADALDFEEAALHACEMIIAKDSRIGKIPPARRVKTTAAKKKTKFAKRVKSVKIVG
jgi:hypothetical protein